MHAHLLPTPYRYPPYSAACLPFNWMLREGAAKHAAELELGFRPELEQEADTTMGFDTEWVQTKHNQGLLLDTFFSAIQPQRSLCFFYAKRTPLTEDPRRVLIGVGWVTHVGEAVEYRYSQPGPLTSLIWERAVQHSIRPDFGDGFLLPYHEVLAYLAQHPEEDPAQYVAFVPDDQFWAFSYASEHVSNDGAIGPLLSCSKALRAIHRIVPGPWERVLGWIDARLNELWRMRGPCPGLGAALTAFGLPHGTLLAYELERIVASERNGGNLDPWPMVDLLLRDPNSLNPELHKGIGDTLRRKWCALPEERRALLKLLSRLELAAEQATRYYVHEDDARKEVGIDVTDAQLLANPYLLYELDRVAPEPISLSTIDRGLFPDQSLREQYPLPEPSRVAEATDARRVRAYVVNQLEISALEGHTLRQREEVVRGIRELDIQPACPVDGDLMDILEGDFAPVVRCVDMAEGQKAYQLQRLCDAGKIIRESILKRANGRRHEANIDWRRRLDDALGPVGTQDAELEVRARTEKAAALQELFSSRVSVLLGPAGTGKTTLLRVLCGEPETRVGGILLLAPTGKARVRMETQIGIKGAQTIAQFLLPLGRYYAPTRAYRLSERERVDAYRTVIIDEASMLTEPQLAALLDALKGVSRLVLVGDSRQLPPIGEGRPFLDIVRELTPRNLEALFPRIGPGYAELTVRRRQQGREREDLLLAEWFSGRPVDAGADVIWSHPDAVQGEHLTFARWDSVDELKEKLLDVLLKELRLSGRNDESAFELSLGGTPYGGGVYFWAGQNGQAGACAHAEDWQILSPVRNAPFGVDALNRLLQETFRGQTRTYALQKWGRKIPPPMGPQGILYGDKVINTQNQRRDEVWPKTNALRYVANGEIGIVVGQFKTQKWPFKRPPWKLEVEFSSQPGFKYGYGGQRDFGEEAQPPLELAYALTVHKAQGSEFGLTLLILPNPCRLLSRELLYTALTRQQNRVIIFHQGEWHELWRFSDDYYSETARRLTNLFRAPEPVALRDRFLEEGLIHRTRRGESVRSKSEVIIADLLYSKGLDYLYERPLQGKDGSVRFPDFIIEDVESGITVYWEHLGMMADPYYRHRWEQKQRWYRDQGIVVWEKGGGPNGTLVTSQDSDRGGIDSGAIERLIDEVFKP